MRGFEQVLAFEHLMLTKLNLQENIAKGDWTKTPIAELHALLLAEVEELSEAIEQFQLREQSYLTALDIAIECADVANFAMMISDSLRERFAEEARRNQSQSPEDQEAREIAREFVSEINNMRRGAGILGYDPDENGTCHCPICTRERDRETIH